ncbi:MAG: PAS domain-containing sensor histidine kinase [Acidobacteria bacterium]|nr:PAS domain-containing sensor histidine kinase [Acidobacteriota bacterium]
MPGPIHALVPLPAASGSEWFGEPARLGLLALVLGGLGAAVLLVSLVLLFRSGGALARVGEAESVRRVLVREPGRDARDGGGGAFPPEESLMTEMPGAVVVLSRGRIRCATREFGRQVGLAPPALQGREFKEFLDPEHLLQVVDRLQALDRGSAARCHLSARLRGGGPVLALTAARIHHGGEAVVLVSFAPVVVAAIGPPGVPDPAVAPGREMPPEGPEPPAGPPAADTRGNAPGPPGPGSRPREAADFLADVSHELQTPLVSVRGYTELMLKGRMGPLTPDQERGLQASLRNIDRLIQRIDELIAFSRPEGGEELRLEDFPLWEVIDEAIETVQEKTVRRRASITASYGTNRLQVRADRRRILQVFTNLLHNAVKFNREGGAVTVTVRDRDPAFLEVEVRDTGIGIPRHALPRIFDRHYRVGTPESAAREGSGLGLAIAKEILDRHGCPIRVISEPSVGTAFTFPLPRAAASPSPRPPERRPA